MREITKVDIEAVRQPWVWDLGNSFLYELCHQHPLHVNDDAIIAKIWLIGRSYAASIERRRGVREFGDEFYERTVAPEMKSAPIDTWLETLPANALPGCSESIAVHKQLQDLFHKMTQLNKRSLASKYLHFHRRDAFFIYDSRALRAITTVVPHLSRIPDIDATLFDDEYKKFVRRAVWLRDHVHLRHGVWLTPREVDKLLLRITDNELRYQQSNRRRD